MRHTRWLLVLLLSSFLPPTASTMEPVSALGAPDPQQVPDPVPHQQMLQEMGAVLEVLQADAAVVATPQDADWTDADVSVMLTQGEEALELGELNRAKALFAAIVDQAPDTELAPMAAYKLAWTEWNRGDHKAAITEMRRSVDWAVNQPDLHEVASADLARFRAGLSH